MQILDPSAFHAHPSANKMLNISDLLQIEIFNATHKKLHNCDKFKILYQIKNNLNISLQITE
jgi:hypothetical protein